MILLWWFYEMKGSLLVCVVLLHCITTASIISKTCQHKWTTARVTNMMSCTCCLLSWQSVCIISLGPLIPLGPLWYQDVRAPTSLSCSEPSLHVHCVKKRLVKLIWCNGSLVSWKFEVNVRFVKIYSDSSLKIIIIFLLNVLFIQNKNEHNKNNYWNNNLDAIVIFQSSLGIFQLTSWYPTPCPDYYSCGLVLLPPQAPPAPSLQLKHCRVCN